MRIRSANAIAAMSSILAVAACGGGSGLRGEPEMAVQSQTQGTVTGGDVISVNPAADQVDTLTLENQGSGTLRVQEVALLDQDPEGSFSLEPAGDRGMPSEGDPLVLAPESDTDAASSWSVNLGLSSDQGEPSATLLIRSNSAINDAERVEIGIQAEEQRPEIDVPAQIDFSQVKRCETETKDLQILNKGSTELRVTGLVLTGSPSFSVIRGDERWTGGAEGGEGNGNDDCDGQLEGDGEAANGSEGVTFDDPITLESGGTATLQVRFAPRGPEAASGTLVLQSNDPQHKDGVAVQLVGNQDAPTIEVDPGRVEFGGRLIGEPASVQVTVSSEGAQPLEIAGLGLTSDSASDFRLDLGGMPTESGTVEEGTEKITSNDEPVVLGVGDEASFEVRFTPNEKNQRGEDGQPVPDVGRVAIQSNAFRSNVEVKLTGFGVEETCPTSVVSVDEGEEVIPQTKLHLVGSESFSPSGSIDEYQWTVKQPPGSQSVFLPSASRPDPTFTANVAGDYEFCLTVVDESGTESCSEACKTVTVTPDQAIHVELLWDTPNDPDETDEGPGAGADMDLHFLHPLATGHDCNGDGQLEPWFDEQRDCYWFTCKPGNRKLNWGSPDPDVDDDPALDRDDTDGAGPENINLNIPQDGLTYRVGVHYFRDHNFGPSKATVRVYIHSSLVFEIADVEMTQGEMWEAAKVSWPSGDVVPVQSDSGGRKIIDNCQSPIGVQ